MILSTPADSGWPVVEADVLSSDAARVAPGAPGGRPVSLWYLRSTADGDTHRGRLFADGRVMAGCGVVFTPRKALRDRGPALPGYPPDSDQVCPRCVRRAAR